MKKNNGLIASFIPLIITISLFVVFNARIECQPNHAGFWFVFVLGMSAGVALIRIIMWYKETSKNPPV